MNYQIVSASSLWMLADEVKQEIHKGWKPQGGILAFEVAGNVLPLLFHQAMIWESRVKMGDGVVEMVFREVKDAMYADGK